MQPFPLLLLLALLAPFVSAVPYGMLRRALYAQYPVLTGEHLFSHWRDSYAHWYPRVGYADADGRWCDAGSPDPNATRAQPKTESAFGRAWAWARVSALDKVFTLAKESDAERRDEGEELMQDIILWT